jgi:N-acetylglutamate synthase-like GNAT family acetyltransferase
MFTVEIESKGTTCAGSLTYFDDDKLGVCQVTSVWVDPRFRRRGIGTDLFRELASRDTTTTTVELDDVSSCPAFYDRLGFEWVDRDQGPERRVETKILVKKIQEIYVERACGKKDV